MKEKYQLVAVLYPKAEEKSKQLTLTEIEAFLKKEKLVFKREHFGMKELVYKIKSSEKGDFWIWNMESETPIKLKELNLYLNRNKDVIRYLILKV